MLIISLIFALCILPHIQETQGVWSLWFWGAGVCVCVVCMCSCGPMHMCSSICVCMWRPEASVGHLPSLTALHIILKRSLIIPGIITSPRLTGPWAPGICLSLCGVAGITYWTFTWVLRTWTQILMFAYKHFVECVSQFLDPVRGCLRKRKLNIDCRGRLQWAESEAVVQEKAKG